MEVTSHVSYIIILLIALVVVITLTMGGVATLWEPLKKSSQMETDCLNWATQYKCSETKIPASVEASILEGDSTRTTPPTREEALYRCWSLEVSQDEFIMGPVHSALRASCSYEGGST
ncbi:MAG: hypothetical protein JW727_04305 [Candidatus Aenigmarchaeota archaeon]|nr:hypothetical protein [Candidatus Aenigmarchaeota archaeon]